MFVSGRSIEWQSETRIAGLDVKIAKLDAELLRYRDQMRRLKEGSAKV